MTSTRSQRYRALSGFLLITDGPWWENYQELQVINFNNFTLERAQGNMLHFVAVVL
jgi:hypothetical protein